MRDLFNFSFGPAGMQLRQAFLVLVAGFFLTIVWADDAQAVVVCQVDNSGLDFGTSDTGTGTINFTCTNYATSAVSLTLCARRGNPSWPGNNSQPAMTSGGNNVDFNVYTNAALSQIWTQSQHLTTSITIGAGFGISVQGSLQFYGRIPGGQSPVPGAYSASFFNSRLGTLRNGNCQTRDNGSVRFFGQQFTLPIAATIANACTVTALGPADLGIVPASSSPVSGATSISVNCPNGTAYNIGLRPSNGSSVGQGLLSGTGANTDQPPYQLRSVSVSGPIWGNTASVSGPGNGVSGVGNGNDQAYPVHVTMPDSDYTPDSYRDTVRVTVHY